MSSLVQGWNDLVESITPTVHSVQQDDEDDQSSSSIFLPRDYLVGTFLPAVMATAVVLTALYGILLRTLPVTAKNKSSTSRARLAYQITNACFNAIVGMVGVYLEYAVLPKLPLDRSSPAEIILGFHQELYLVSAMQLGYQIWCLPVAVFQANESLEMIAHHVAVVISAVMTGCLTLGFRPVTPFLWGVTELSSVPLAIMNILKDNKDWSDRVPSVFPTVRLIFAFSFLMLRNVMIWSRHRPYFIACFVVAYVMPWGWYKSYMILQFVMAFLLTILQMYWGSKISSALLDLVCSKVLIIRRITTPKWSSSSTEQSDVKKLD